MHAIDGRIFLSGIKYFSLKRFFHKDIPNESLDPKTTLLENIYKYHTLDNFISLFTYISYYFSIIYNKKRNS